MSKRQKKRRKLFRDLKSGRVAPLYYVYGPDPYMLDAAIDAIVEAACPDGTNEFNFEKFRGRDVTGDEIRSAAETLPFMTKRRVVLVRDAQELPTAELDELIEYFEDPADTTVLIFHAMTADKSLDGRLRAVKKLKKNAESYELTAFYENELDDFIVRQAGRRGMRLDRAAKAYLVEAVGTDLSSLDGALEKIDLYVGPGEDPRMVAAETVKEIIAETRVHNIFALTESLGKRDFEQSLKVLDAMLLAGEPPLRISYMIARHFRIVAKLHDPSLRNANRNKAAGAVGVSPYFLKDYKADARRFSRPEIEQIRHKLLEADLSLKSSNVSDRAIMEGLLYEICYRPTRDGAAE